MIINDSNYLDLVNDAKTNGLCGTLPRKSRFGALPFANGAPLTDDELIPWEAMPDMIADEERNKSSLEHLFYEAGLHVLMQGQLNYCWMFSADQVAMVLRAQMNLPYEELSASSIGAPLVNFQNVGGYIEDALHAMTTGGIASTKFVPMATNNPQDFRKGWQQDAKTRLVTMWRDIPRDPQAVLTHLLLKRPEAVGLNWWRHSVTYLRAVDRYPKLPANNPFRYGVRGPNSWDVTWGDNGWFTIEGQHWIPDQCYCAEQFSFA